MLKIFLRKWIFLFVLTIFDLIIALRTSIDFFYFLFWFLVTLVIISFAWVAIGYVSAKLSFQRKIPGKIEEEDALEIETVVDNIGFLPILNLLLEDYLPCAIPTEREKIILLEYFEPKSSLVIKYHCQCPRRGRYKIGPFFIYFFDPLGLFFLKRAYFIYSELYVYPRTFNIKKLPHLVRGTDPWFGIETGRVSGDEHEFYGIREYRDGDPIKKIHWFSTARKNMLIVKQFQHQTFRRATIIFNLEKYKDFGEGKESISEYIIKIAASLAKYLIERDVSLEIIAHTEEIVHIPFNKGPAHLEDIFRFLAIAQAESRVNIGDIFDEFSTHIPGDSTLIVIISDKDWEYLPTMLSLEKKNIFLIPLILVSESFLYPHTKQGIIKDVRIKIPEPQGFDFVPIFFYCRENLEEAFLK